MAEIDWFSPGMSRPDRSPRPAKTDCCAHLETADASRRTAGRLPTGQACPMPIHCRFTNQQGDGNMKAEILGLRTIGIILSAGGGIHAQNTVPPAANGVQKSPPTTETGGLSALPSARTTRPCGSLSATTRQSRRHDRGEPTPGPMAAFLENLSGKNPATRTGSRRWCPQRSSMLNS